MIYKTARHQKELKALHNFGRPSKMFRKLVASGGVTWKSNFVVLGDEKSLEIQEYPAIIGNGPYPDEIQGDTELYRSCDQFF